MWIFYLYLLITIFYSQIFGENRLVNDKANDYTIRLDGADFRVPEYGGNFYSHKYKKSGFRYEVGLCIKTGWIVWINGSYECHIWLDISIFRNNLLSCLGKDK